MRPALADAWNELRAEATRARPTVAQRGNVPPPETWLRYGVGIDGSSPPGEFRIEPEGDRFVTRLLPAGIHSNLFGRKRRCRPAFPTVYRRERLDPPARRPASKFFFQGIEPANLLDRLRDGLASTHLRLDRLKLGDDLLRQLLFAWHWLHPLGCSSP